MNILKIGPVEKRNSLLTDILNIWRKRGCDYNAHLNCKIMEVAPIF